MVTLTARRNMKEQKAQMAREQLGLSLIFVG
jgi:hypothetical protein